MAGGLLKLPGDLRPLAADAVDPLPKLDLRPALLGGQVEEVALFLVQLAELPGESFAGFVAQLEVLADGDLHGFSHPVPQLGGQYDRVGVVLFYGCFHDVHWDIRLVAAFLLPSPAQEVKVLSTITPSRHDRKAMLAASAPHQSFEEVRVAPLTHTASGVSVEDALHAVEEFRVNKRFVAAGVLNALIRDHAQVITVSQHPVQRVTANGLVASRCLEVKIGNNLVQAVERMLAGGKQLEEVPNERRAFVVQDDAVDLVSVYLDCGVEVAELGESERATVARLVGHLDFNVFAVTAYFHPVNDVRYSLHAVGQDAFAKVFLGGDELDAALVELSLGEPGLQVVAEGARPHVDEHIFDLRVLRHVAQQFSEHRPLLDALRRGARFDELTVQHHVHSACFVLREVALRVNAVAVRVNVGGRVELAFGADAQVGDTQLNSLGRFGGYCGCHACLLLLVRPLRGFRGCRRGSSGQPIAAGGGWWAR